MPSQATRRRRGQLEQSKSGWRWGRRGDKGLAMVKALALEAIGWSVLLKSQVVSARASLCDSNLVML